MNNQVIQEITTSAPDGMWSDIVPGLAVKIVFKSDGSGQYWDKYWGFRVDQLDPVNYASVVYSPHPYANNWNDTKTLINSTPTQTATRVHFDRIELEPGVDYIIIRDINNVPYQWITGSYPDGFTSKAVPGPGIRVQLASDGSGGAWGYNADAVLGASTADPADSPPSGPTLAESDHNYASNTDRTWILTNPDANAVSSKVHFSKMEIENSYDAYTSIDYLYILDASDTVIQRLTGKAYDFWSDYVPGRVVKIRLVSNNDGDNWWGFRADKIASSVSHPGLAQSDHPYANSTDKTWLIVNPDTDAVSSKVHFSKMEIENSYDAYTSIDYLYILDASDTVIQRLTGKAYDFWSDYVPGRVVKIRLVSNNDGDNWWGFRADKIASSVSHPGLAQSDHPYANSTDKTWLIVNPDTDAVSSKVHFSKMEIENSYDAYTSIDYLYILDANDAVIQRLTGKAYDFWSDYVPGRVVKIRLISNNDNDNWWGFRADDIRSAPPTPILTSIDPTSIVAGSPGFTLTVTGASFVPESVVRWDSTNLATTFVSESQLTAVVPASLVATKGTVNITVYSHGAPGTGQSNALQFGVLSPLPALTSLNKTMAMAGDGAFNLELTGSNFVPSSVARWNGTDLATTFVNGTLLRAAVPASLLTAAGTFNVAVFNPSPGGGSSAAQVFTVNNPSPTLSSVSPTTAVVHRSFTLTVNGSNFNRSSVIRWGGAALPTIYASATRLTCEVPADVVSASGSITVTVFNPGPGGGETSARTVTVWSKTYLPLILNRR